MQLDGVLFFPVTPFTADGAVAADVLGKHVAAGLSHGPGGIFAACGTGEFHALGLDEHRTVVDVAVRTAAGEVPVFAGTGGPLPHAVACARQAAAAGADGLLLLPPYLVTGPQRGVVRYVAAVAAAAGLPLIVYQRDQLVFTPDTVVELAAIPSVVGLKDGGGDLDLVARTVMAVRARVGEEFMFFNGRPTAELTQAAYGAAGVSMYSSAAFAFVPEVSTAFYAAVRGGGDSMRDRLLAEFFGPFAELRDQVPGYAVALVKAGVADATGLPVGGVRPPLVDPTPEHRACLHAIIERGRELVGRG